MKTNLLLLLIFCFATMMSCTKDMSNETGVSDEGLSSVATSTDGSMIVNTIENGDHSKWNIRMNDVAMNAKVKSFNDYPLHSMLIKEKHSSDGKIAGYDVMYKDPSNQNSSDGWMYVEVSGNGNVIYHSGEKGVNCQNCHKALGRNGLIH